MARPVNDEINQLIDQIDEMRLENIILKSELRLMARENDQLKTEKAEKEEMIQLLEKQTDILVAKILNRRTRLDPLSNLVESDIESPTVQTAPSPQTPQDGGSFFDFSDSSFVLEELEVPLPELQPSTSNVPTELQLMELWPELGATNNNGKKH